VRRLECDAGSHAMPTLADHDAQMLASSAIAPEVIAAREYGVGVDHNLYFSRGNHDSRFVKNS